MIVARAFSSIEKLCALTEHLLAPDGHILAMTGHLPDSYGLQQEHNANSLQVSSGGKFSVIRAKKLFVPGETAERNIVILRKSAA